MWLLIIPTQDKLYEHFLEKLQFAHIDESYRPFKYILENKTGIITVARSSDNDVLYGGGVYIYDGKFNVDHMHDTNMIIRAYWIATLHHKPENVLMIGLGSGSWAQVLASYKAIKSLEIIEINKAYIDVINKYPEIASILNNSKIQIYTAYGRRWLRSINKKYD